MFLTFNYFDQAAYNRFDLGVEIEISNLFIGVLASSQIVETVSDSDFLLSVNPLIGLQIKNFKIGLSYDFPVSSIGNVGGTGEITMQYILGENNNKNRERLWQVKN